MLRKRFFKCGMDIYFITLHYYNILNDKTQETTRKKEKEYEYDWSSYCHAKRSGYSAE